jgi:hypothetical protein
MHRLRQCAFPKMIAVFSWTATPHGSTVVRLRYGKAARFFGIKGAGDLVVGKAGGALRAGEAGAKCVSCWAGGLLPARVPNPTSVVRSRERS